MDTIYFSVHTRQAFDNTCDVEESLRSFCGFLYREMKERHTDITNLEIEKRKWEIQTLVLQHHVLKASLNPPNSRKNGKGFGRFSRDVFPSLKEVVFLYPSASNIKWSDMKPGFSTIDVPETNAELSQWEKCNTIIGIGKTKRAGPIYKCLLELRISVATRRSGRRPGEIDNTAGRQRFGPWNSKIME